MMLQEIAQTELNRIDLRTRGLLITLHLHAFTARKYDRKVSTKTAETHQASKDAGRYNKKLIDTEKYLKPITKLQSEIRQYHYDHTLPWMDGSRILNVLIFDEYCSQLNDYMDKHDAMVNTFMAVYPQAKLEAETLLGEMFNPDEYPGEDMVRSKFDVEFYVSPLPDVEDFRMTLPDSVVQQTALKIEQTYQSSLQDAHRRLYDCIKAIAEKLPAYDKGQIKTFRDTVITNLQEVIDLMPALNISDDARLKFITEMADRKLAKHEPSQLRDDPLLRSQVAQDAANILAKMNIGSP